MTGTTTFSLRQAAEEAGVSKSTIFRAIKAGRLSAARTDDGGFAIDPAELFRIYTRRSVQRPENVALGQDATGMTPAVAALLEEQIKALRETVRRLDEQVLDLKEDRDRWRTNAEVTQRLLTDQRTESSKVAHPWWRRLVAN